MKSEERHKLQQNELADWLGRVLTVVKPYTNAILAVVLLVVVVIALSSWWKRQTASEAAGAWDQVYAALATENATQLNKVAEDNPGTEVAQWAAILAGDIHLTNGCRLLFTNKSTASQDLQKAVDSYAKVREEARSSMLRERATFGLARAYEALAGTRQSQGELDKAIKNYEDLQKNWPDGAYVSLANNRLEQLKTPAAKTFYDKFAQFDPQPSFSAPPGAGPSFDPKGLQEPKQPKSPGQGMDIEFPNVGKDLGKDVKNKPSASDKAAPKSSGTAPISPAVPPLLEKPAGKPAETPAEKPADKPVEEKK